MEQITVKPINIQKQYLTSIEKIFESSEKNHEEAAKTIVCSYQIFTDDDESLFKHLISLKQKYPQQIEAFLIYLAQQGFPSGIHNLKQASETLKQLTSDLGNFPTFNNILKGTGDDVVPFPSPMTTNAAVDWSNWPAQKIAEAMTLRDAIFFQSIKISDIKAVLMGAKSPDSIKIMGEHFNRTKDWITHQIKNTKDERKSIIEKMKSIADYLIHIKNFHGAFQFSIAFYSCKAEDLLPEKMLKSLDNILNLGHLHNNFSNYRTILNKNLKDPNCIPVFSLFLSNLTDIYQSCKSPRMNSNEEMIKHVKSIALAVEHFSRSRRIYHSSFKGKSDTSHPAINYFCNLPDYKTSTGQ